MRDLKEKAADFFTLVVKNRQLEAIEKYYYDHIRQVENYDDPIEGKELLYRREQENLANITLLRTIVADVYYNVPRGTVMGEMFIEYETLSGDRYRLEEAFKQRWRYGMIVWQRFYYEKTIKIEATRNDRDDSLRHYRLPR